MVFKGPGRWPHVQEPGPGSRRRRSSSGSAPRHGWLEAGELVRGPQPWGQLSVPTGVPLCHRMLHRDSSAPVICVPSIGHGHPKPLQPRREGMQSGEIPLVPPEMFPQRQATPSGAPRRAGHKCHQCAPQLETLGRATIKPGRGCLWHRGTEYNTSVCLSTSRTDRLHTPEPRPCVVGALRGANILRVPYGPVTPPCPSQPRARTAPGCKHPPCPVQPRVPRVLAPAHATHAVPRVPAGTVTVPLPPVPARTAWHGPSRGTGTATRGRGRGPGVTVF